MIRTQKITSISRTNDGKSCELRFLKKGKGEETLQFPLEQLQALSALILQVERGALPQLAEGRRINALVPTNVGIAPEQGSANVILDFHVGTMRFAFRVTRELVAGIAKALEKF